MFEPFGLPWLNGVYVLSASWGFIFLQLQIDMQLRLF
jgi:hypothetical protein